MKVLTLGDLTTASPWIYDYAQILLSFNYRLIKKHLKQWNGFKAGNTCLDIACGVGALQHFIEENKLHYRGVDINQKYLDYAQAHHGPHFQNLDAKKLSQLNRQFDCLISIGLFHHLSDNDCQQVLDQAQSVLKENGQYFILDAIPAGPGNPIGSFLRNQDAGNHIRSMDEWSRIFGEFFIIDRSFQLAHWPYDYGVFHLRRSTD
jgi:ubiquinone/menaquinone biosynthesis C-methylase UbiE